MIGGLRQDASALLGRAMQLHKAGKFGEALQFYQRVLVLQPLSADALTYSALALLELGKARDAAERLQAALTLRPNHAETLGFLGNALQLSGRRDEAERAFRAALAITPGNPRLHNNYGILLLEAKRYEEARASFERALAANPAYAEASINLSQVHLKLGQSEPAVGAAQRAVDSGGKAEAYNQLGNALAACDRYDEAIAAYRQATAHSPRFLDALNNLAVALVAGGRAREALAVTDSCLQIHPGDVTALATRSVALSEAGERKAQEQLVDLDCMLKAQRIDPGPRYPSLAAFNEALAAHIRGHPSLRYAPEGHATRNGLHSGDLLAEPKGPVEDLERIIVASFECYVAELPAERPAFLGDPPQQWFLDIWALVLDRQGYQVPHIHASGWVSGVYYVAVEGAVSDETAGHEGWIEFGRPQAIYRPTVEPRLRLIRPEEGRLLLFPSYFFHRTIPFTADAKRICVAFDICPAPRPAPGRA